ncbi:hypothetical protein [Pseudomonas sp. Irchel 3E20]|uniref:hypothetical protein n=1 Tax=Pseudomonas sp. Irchel 3E20 TaxID=2008983 RepID=UPI000BA4BCD4|nr:hypothetical protein [Pseudomonas sp. Irchel 3E20]
MNPLHWPAVLLLAWAASAPVWAQGSCPPGYGKNWQGQCLDCSKPMSEALCAGDAGGYSTSAEPDRVGQASEALGAVGDYLQKRADAQDREAQQQRQQAEQQEALENQRNARGVAAFNNAVDNLENTDWESQALQSQAPRPGKKGLDCDCGTVVARCEATIDSLKRTGKTGFSFRVSSTEAQCSKVSYFIDGRPNLTVLNRRSSAIEQASGQKNLTLQQFDIERCEVCASQ